MNKKIHTVTHDFLKGSFKQLNYKDVVLSQATGSEIQNLTLQPGSSFDWQQGNNETLLIVMTERRAVHN